MSKIALFKPANYKPCGYKESVLNSYFGREFKESSRGRWSLLHILKSFNTKKRVLLPVYICSTVLDAVKKLNLKYSFYDLDERDLNADIKSIEKMLLQYDDIEAVLVASMYGNPADLESIGNLCKEYNVKLIDDAAQSYGATLNSKNIGTFGDAGFIAFSPGKPTATYLGSFYWTSNEYTSKQKIHRLSHFISFFSFYFNRYKAYSFGRIPFFKILEKADNLLGKIVDLSCDRLSTGDKRHIAGVLESLNSGEFDFREEFYAKFITIFDNNSFFRVVKGIRGNSKPHKIVIIFDNNKNAEKALNIFNNANISVINGYRLLDSSTEFYPNAEKLKGKIIELPIEDNELRMNYLNSTVENILSRLEE